MTQLVTEFTVGGKTYEADLDVDLAVHRDDLMSDFENHAQRFAFYATAYELALDHEGRLKIALERAYAKLDEQVRSNPPQAIKLTEKIVENIVITSQDYVVLQDAYMEAKKQTGLLRAAKDAMIQRKDMLVSCGANYRAELNSD